MTLYDIIFQWFSANIWSNNDLENNFLLNDFMDSSITMADWLSHTSTIIVLILLVVCCGLFIRWIFKVISGAILLK